MSGSNKLVFLGLITLLVVVAAVVTSKKHAPTSSRTTQYVFPGLTEKINEVARIEVSGKDGTLSIKGKGKDWVIEQSDNYPASFGKVRQAAITIADLKILAEKTGDPAYYSRLGVEDPEGKNAKSKLVTLYDATGGKLASLIIGKSRMSSAAADSKGYYIRMPGGTHALLVEGDLNIDAKPADWFDPDIINVKPEHISEVVINHPDVTPITLSRSTAKDDFVLADIPAGKEPQSSYTLNRIEDILEGVRVQDVRSADKIKFPDKPTVATVKTYDGMTAEITSATVDGVDWSRFQFRFQAPAPTNETVGKDTKEAAGTKPAAQTADNNAKPVEAATQASKDKLDEKLVDQLNKKTSGWVYKIPTYKFNLFTRKLDDLVKDKEPEKKVEKNKK